MTSDPIMDGVSGPETGRFYRARYAYDVVKARWPEANEQGENK